MDAVLLSVAAGAFSAVVGGVVALVRWSMGIALRAERGRADDWRTAARTEREANAVNAVSIQRLITTQDRMATTQDRMMGMLESIAPSGRSAA